jgi:hypothetical protein
MSKKHIIVICVSCVLLTVFLVCGIVLFFLLSSRDDNSSANNEADEIGTQGTSSTKQSSIETVLPEGEASIIFLHHSTGENIWNGGVSEYFENYNDDNDTNYQISELAYPSDEYGWENYPYDYWNLWVNHDTEDEYMGQPTLETLTTDYDVIIWKHCFPVGYIEPDDGNPDIASSTKTLVNYKLQYEALKEKMHEYPNAIFIVWTGAALIESETNSSQATRTKEFFDWVKDTWDEPDDNIYLFDFYELETEGSIYMSDAYSAGDSHPNEAFSATVAVQFSQRVIDIIEDNI